MHFQLTAESATHQETIYLLNLLRNRLMRPSLRDYVLNAAPVGAPHSRLRPEPPRQLTLEPAGATRVNTSRRGTPSVQRAMGCDTQSRSACTRQDRLRLRQRTHCPNRIMISPNPRTDRTDGLRVTHGLHSTLGFCSRRAAFGAYGCVETRTKCIWGRRNSSQTLIPEQKLKRYAQIQEKVSYCHKFHTANIDSSIGLNDSE